VECVATEFPRISDAHRCGCRSPIRLL